MKDYIEILKEKWEDEVIEESANCDRNILLCSDTLIILKQVGFQIRLARKRRKYSLTSISSLIKISRTTLWKIEKGDPMVSIGAYSAVLNYFGLDKDLLHIAKDDAIGQKMLNASLEKIEKYILHRNLSEEIDDFKAHQCNLKYQHDHI